MVEDRKERVVFALGFGLRGRDWLQPVHAESGPDLFVVFMERPTPCLAPK